MDPTLRAVLAVSMRWIHVTSVVTLIGGFIFARFALAPALATDPGTGTRDRSARGLWGIFVRCCIRFGDR